MIYTYIRRKFVFIIASIVLTVGFVGLLSVPTVTHQKRFSGEVLKEEPEMDKEVVAEITDSASVFNFEGTEFLVKDAIPEINQLITDYYSAMMAFDMDWMESLVSDISRVDQKLMRAKLEYIESISNIMCYTTEGPTEGTYRVYVYYDLKLRGIDTLAPALSAMYLSQSSDGNYVIYLSEVDDDAQEFIDEADASIDVQLLSSLVSERFNNVINSDEAMKEFYTMMEAAMNNTSQTEAPESAAPDNAAPVEVAPEQ